MDANQYSAVSAKKSSEYIQKPTSSICLPLSATSGLRHTQNLTDVSKYYHLLIKNHINLYYLIILSSLNSLKQDFKKLIPLLSKALSRCCHNITGKKCKNRVKWTYNKYYRLPLPPLHPPSNRLKWILLPIIQIHISQHYSSLLFNHLPFILLAPLAE